MTTVAKKYTRRESERLRRVELILDAAEGLFLEKGFAVTTMNDIGEAAEFGAGDLVTFPRGMDCVWTITQPVKKHYKFG